MRFVRSSDVKRLSDIDGKVEMRPGHQSTKQKRYHFDLMSHTVLSRPDSRVFKREVLPSSRLLRLFLFKTATRWRGSATVNWKRLKKEDRGVSPISMGQQRRLLLCKLIVKGYLRQLREAKSLQPASLPRKLSSRTLC